MTSPRVIQLTSLSSVLCFELASCQSSSRNSKHNTAAWATCASNLQDLSSTPSSPAEVDLEETSKQSYEKWTNEQEKLLISLWAENFGIFKPINVDFDFQGPRRGKGWRSIECFVIDCEQSLHKSRRDYVFSNVGSVALIFEQT